MAMTEKELVQVKSSQVTSQINKSFGEMCV